MALRISGGALKGRLLAVPRGAAVRPLTGRLKELWFACLGDKVRGARVADLYAGVGAFGLEALSRGAAAVTFVERDATLTAFLEDNLRRLNLTAAARVYGEDALSYLDITRPAVAYDIVFLDPPYGRGLVFRTVEKLARWPGFGPDTVGVAKTFKKEHFAGPPPLALLDERTAGDDRLLFFTRAG